MGFGYFGHRNLKCVVQAASADRVGGNPRMKPWQDAWCSIEPRGPVLCIGTGKAKCLTRVVQPSVGLKESGR